MKHKQNTKKPPLLYRILSRKIVEKGYLQECYGKIKGQGRHIVYYADRTIDKTVKGLKIAVANTPRFKPLKYTPVQDISAVDYIPFWKKAFWNIKK
jgi:hypothetical protein